MSVTELELAFAQDPESDAYLKLTEAYLAQHRFMEAMVVCKKGIKVHADALDGRLLLARVYKEQKKYKRALDELTTLLEEHPESAPVRLAMGRVQLESGQTDEAIETLKRAIDLDGSLGEATELLADQGVVYPEPPSPEPAGPEAPIIPENSDGPAALPEVPEAAEAPPGFDAPDLEAPARVPTTGRTPPPVPREPVAAEHDAPPGGAPIRSAAAPQAPQAPKEKPRPLTVRPQRLEGEDELEALAQKLNEAEPPRGKPITTVLLAVVLLVVGGAVVTLRVMHKQKVEAMDALTAKALPAFNRDTYGGYKEAASHLERILEDHDEKHPLTLGRLAHVYTILYGEHGETGLKPKLDELLARAARYAPEVSHTASARGLAGLYEGKDRRESASVAQNTVRPLVQRSEDAGAMTHAHLSLGIIEMVLGRYQVATERLRKVKELLPGSVRARVWHARAAAREGRYGVAKAGFLSALRVEPKHSGARVGLALARLERGDLNGAQKDLERFEALVKESPKEISLKDTAQAEFVRSVIHRSAGAHARAEAAYDRAVRLDPENADFPYGLGRRLLKSEQAEAALPYLKKAVEAEKTRGTFLVELAEAEMHLSNYTSAETHIQTALRSSPDYLPAAIAMARLMRRTGRKGTEAYLKGLFSKWPGAKVEINLELGRLYRSLKRLPDAQDVLEVAIGHMESHPPVVQSAVLLSYGKVMKDRHEREAAIKSFKKAAELGSAEGWYRMAIVFAQSGSATDRVRAKRACGRYLKAGSNLRYSAKARALYDNL